MLNGTNSLINGIMGSSANPLPTVGMGATRLGYTDRHPCTIVAVTAKSVTVQDDFYKRIDDNGMSESQEYEYTPNPEGYKAVYTLRQNGAYVRQGSSVKDGERLAIGFREKYYDFSF